MNVTLYTTTNYVVVVSRVTFIKINVRPIRESNNIDTDIYANFSVNNVAEVRISSLIVLWMENIMVMVLCRYL